MRGGRRLFRLLFLCLLPGLAQGQFPWRPASLEGLDLEAGHALFRKTWVGAPASTRASDGLGPLYNARSCAQCHPGGGGGPALPRVGGTPGPSLVLMLARISHRFPTAAAPGHALRDVHSVGVLDIPSSMAARSSVANATHAYRDVGGRATQGAKAEDAPWNSLATENGEISGLGEGSRFGRQLQTAALAGLAAEARLTLGFEEIPFRFPDGEQAALRRPRFDIEPLDGAPLEKGLRLSPRLAPPLRGLAGLEAIPVTAIAALADPGDRDGDGIRGRMPRGRFGRQGGEDSLRAQVALALGRDLGLGNPLLPAPEGDCSARQTECLAAAGPASQALEVSPAAFELLVAYVGAIPAPPAPPAATPARAGRALFDAAGCGACHRPDLRAGEARPWSDLLLHDMGEGLADFTPAGEALPTLWRTTPLWGLGLRQDALLHDGRARGIQEAILWHGGEAEAARDRFVSMPKADREVLLDFLSDL